MTCTWQIESAGRQTPAHPHSLTGCAFDLRHGESLSHSREAFSLFFTFLCTDLSTLFSLFTSQCCRGGRDSLGRPCNWVQAILHGYPSKSRHRCRERGLFGQRGALGDPTLATMGVRDVAWEHGGSRASSFCSFLPKEERWGGQLVEQRYICCISHPGARRPRQKKLSGIRTSADPERAEVCGETSVGFHPGPGRGMSNVRPKHGAEERKQRHSGRQRARDAGLRENEGGTSNASCSDPFPCLCSHGCSAGDRGETAPLGRLAEGKAFSSHFGRQSLPLHDRRPFEILCLASSHLFTRRCAVRAAEASLCPGNLAGCSCTVRAGTRRHFSSAVGNELC